MIVDALFPEAPSTGHGNALPVCLISDYHACLSPGQRHSRQIQLSSEAPKGRAEVNTAVWSHPAVWSPADNFAVTMLWTGPR